MRNGRRWIRRSDQPAVWFEPPPPSHDTHTSKASINQSVVELNPTLAARKRQVVRRMASRPPASYSTRERAAKNRWKTRTAVEMVSCVCWGLDDWMIDQSIDRLVGWTGTTQAVHVQFHRQAAVQIDQLIYPSIDQPIHGGTHTPPDRHTCGSRIRSPASRSCRTLAWHSARSSACDGGGAAAAASDAAAVAICGLDGGGALGRSR